MRAASLAWLFALGCRPPPPPASPAADASVVAEVPALSLAGVPFPGDPAVASLLRDGLSLWLSLHPDVAADAGLLGDGLHLPSFSNDAVSRNLAALDAMERRIQSFDSSLQSVDDQIDLRLLAAAIAQDQHALRVEQRFRHRPAEWLEPTSSLLVAHLASPSPVPGAMNQLASQVEDLAREVQEVVTEPTRRDVDTAIGLLDAIVNLFGAQPPSPEVEGALAALSALRDHLVALDDLPEFRMIGAEAYRWRLEHVWMLSGDAESLLAQAEADLKRVDDELAALAPTLPKPTSPTDEERARVPGLDQEGVNRLVDEMVDRYLQRLREMDVLTVPADLAPIRARPTPEALIPLTGDGGSMNPIAPFGPTEGAWWNIEHFPEDTSEDHRLNQVMLHTRSDTNWFGPYAAHEGVPGHHLQLAILRDNPRPARKLLRDTAAVEGWALYAESLFEANGGFANTPAGRHATLRSYRARVRRVVFDVKVETGMWTLQEAADWKHGTGPGEGHVDPELLRTVQWPTQLITYYAGMKAIEDLKSECVAAWGDAYSERRFHDEYLAVGPIPAPLAGWAMGCMEP